jgi:hypothetical protein
MTSVSKAWATMLPREALAALADMVTAADGDAGGQAAEAVDESAVADADAGAVAAPAAEVTELAHILQELRAAGVAWDAAAGPE